MRIRLWKGYHSQELVHLARQSWEHEHELLILCPPWLKDFSFVQFLPAREISFCGHWESLPFLPETKQNFSFPEQPFLGVFTSGTISGESRLVLYSKKNVQHSLEAILQFFDSEKITSVFGYPQPFHTFGLVLGYMLSIYKNIPLYFYEGKYGRAAHAKRLENQDPGMLTLGTPTHFYDLLRYVEATGEKPISTYSCIIGGAPVGVGLWQQIHKQLQINQPSIGYGCTEACPGITHLPPGQAPLQDGEIGYPVQSLASRLTVDGVEIQGPGLCLAMIEDKKLIFPDKVIVRDAVEALPDGRHIYQGRLDLMINRGGLKLSLELVEQTVLRETSIAIVCGTRKDERLGEELQILVKKTDILFTLAIEKISEVLDKHFFLRLGESEYKEVSEFPYNESSKVDRKAVSLMLNSISTKDLQGFLPHREPMLWVDEVLKFSAEGGECRVNLKADGHYFTDGKLRCSSLIEFMAQSYGFINACLAKQSQNSKSLSEAFLVSITDAQFEDFECWSGIGVGSSLRIQIGPSRALGPISMFSGSVWNEHGQCLGRAQLKVFAQPSS